jgi:hypothetical protein
LRLFIVGEGGHSSAFERPVLSVARGQEARLPVAYRCNDLSLVMKCRLQDPAYACVDCEILHGAVSARHEHGVEVDSVHVLGGQWRA